MSSYAPGGLIEAAQHMENAWGQAAFISAEATGIAIDDPNDPHVAVAVHAGRIVYIGISDPMLRAPIDQLNDVLNGLIVNAFYQWRAQLSGVTA